eukprot:69141_1
MAEERKDLDVVVNEDLNQASWIIQGDLMTKFKKAKNGDKYSADFLLHGCSWAIECYPNGYTTKAADHISVYLRCNTLPNKCSKLGVTYQISLEETNECGNTANFFFEDTSCGWHKFVKRDLTMEKLTINVKVFVNATID